MRYLTLCGLLALALAFGLVACAPSGGQEIPVSDTGDAAGQALAPAGDAAGAPQESDIAGTLGVAPPTTGVQIVDVTPMSEEELAAQPPGQTEGGLAQDDVQSAPGDDGEEAALPTGDQVLYVDSDHGFSAVVPANFVARAADPARLTDLIPAPDAAVYFMDPALVDSVMAGTDAPNLEVRVFETGPLASLADWLTAAGMGADQTQTPTQLGSGLSSIEVCGTTMIFPNCSTFVAGGDRVYQLRALDQAGEAMAQSFAVMP